MGAKDFLAEAIQEGASDVFLVAGQSLTFKINGEVVAKEGAKLFNDDTSALLQEIYQMAGREKLFSRLLETGDDDFSFSLPGVGRFRVNAYKQRGSLSAVLRVVLFDLPNSQALRIPPVVMGLSNKTNGLVLVTGPAGSGKSTTLACIIDRINRERRCHIMTLEDPIEFLHKHRLSLVSQREISIDTESYVKALRAALRQAPDVILVGEMRDVETINIAMTAAETGHLVFSTLHTLGAANSIDRIIDAFPPEQQHQARLQLSMVLQAVISQQLLPAAKGRVPAFEIMLANNAVKNMIRESKLHQLDTVIYSNADKGMQTMDACLLKLCKAGEITKDEALTHCMNMDTLTRQLGV